MGSAMTVFSADLVESLRKRAVKAADTPEEGPPGWSLSLVDPGKVVHTFSRLEVKPEYRLCAYLFRTGMGGNGAVYALPAGMRPPPPEDCPADPDRFAEPPVPPDALPDVMDAVVGDRSPLSYLEASLFRRELAEFGAYWHGIEWGAHTVLGGDPRKDMVGDGMDRPYGPVEEWAWAGRMPRIWKPSVRITKKDVRVALHTFTGCGEQRILRLLDVYGPSSYVALTRRYTLGRGPGGYCY